MNGVRYRLVGPKALVTKVIRGAEGVKIYLKLNTVTMIWDAPTPDADVRVGDWLTLYTEVLAHEPDRPAN